MMEDKLEPKNIESQGSPKLIVIMTYHLDFRTVWEVTENSVFFAIFKKVQIVKEHSCKCSEVMMYFSKHIFFQLTNISVVWIWIDIKDIGNNPVKSSRHTLVFHYFL